MTILTVEDLSQKVRDAFEESDLNILVNGLNAKVARIAPCLLDAPAVEAVAEAKMILVGAVSRWAEAGSGALSQQGAGPFQASVDTRQRGSGYNLWPSEITALGDLCDGGDDVAFMVDMTGHRHVRNPLEGVTVNAHLGCEPLGSWSPLTERIAHDPL